MTAVRRVSRRCSGRRPAQTASWIIAWMRGLAAVSAPKCARAAMSRALLYPIPDWPALSVACVMRHTVHRETQEEPFERPLPDLIVDRCRPLFLQDFVAVNPQDVVDTADSQTLSEEGEFCLQILATLDALVHCADDVCFAHELVRVVLSRSDGDSECDASGGNCGDFGHARHVVDPPLGRR